MIQERDIPSDVAVVAPVAEEARHVAPGGWKRAAIGIAVGVAVGVVAALVAPRDEGPRRSAAEAGPRARGD